MIARFIALAILLSSMTHAGVPRYSLNVGESLKYRRTLHLLDADGKPAGGETEQMVEVCALARKGVRWDVVAVIRTKDVVTAVARFTIDDRGEIALADEFRRRPASIEPIREIFPMLPPALDFGGAWEGQADEFGRATRLRQAASEPKSRQFRFEQIDATGVSRFLRQTASGSIWFDSDAQLVTSFDRVESDGDVHRVIRGELVDRERPASGSPAWNLVELDSLLQAFRMEDALADETTARPSKIEMTLSRMDRIWSEFLAQPPRDDTSPFRQFATARRERAAAESDLFRSRARMAQPWLGKAAAHWSFQDESGQTVASETVRKGITIEIFWSSASEASLRMFSVPLALTKELPKTPVSVIFLNIDSDLNAARRATESCSRGNRVVFAGLPMEGQAPAELPVIRILDDQGIIRQVLFGWRPSLADAVQAVRDAR